MTTFSQHTLAAVAHLTADYTLGDVAGEITMDDAWSPYVQARITCSRPPAVTLEQIDPRNNVRVTLTTTQAWGDGVTNWNAFGYRAPVSRSFDLVVRSREIDLNTGELVLELASDEAMLQDRALVATAPERTYGLSIKTAVAYALAKIGAALQPGADDANLVSKAIEPVITNLVPNPGVRAATTGWQYGGSGFTMTRIAATIPGVDHGGFILRGTAAAGANGGPFFHDGEVAGVSALPVTAGQQYTVSMWVRCSVAVSVALNVEWVNSGGGNLGSTTGVPVALVANTWTRLVSTFTAPATAVRAGAYAYTQSAVAAGTTYDAGAHMFMLGNSVPPAYFDGSSTDPGLYSYAWTGTANASASTKTNLPNSDSLIWNPGVDAQSWITPLVQVGGLRLWCDENRRWYLKKSWAVDGQINVSPATGVERATDTISRDTNDWYDSVVIAYRWDDALGLSQLAYDVAGAPGTKTLTISYENTVYPGPGAAAQVLARALGRGRVLALDNVSDYQATPGKALSVSLPDTPIQTGVVSSVRWRFPEAVMSIGSRGLTDTPVTSWLYTAAGKRWQDIPAGIHWNTYTP